MTSVQRIATDQKTPAELLRYVMVFAMREWRSLAVGAGCGLLAVVLYAHTVEPVYSVTLTVTPISSGSSGSLRSLGSVASMIGISNSLSKQTDPYDYYLSGLTSRVAADGLVRNQDLMHRLFEREWSEQKHSWQQPRSPIRFVARKVAEIAGVPIRPWAPPNSERVETFIKTNILVDSDKKTRVTTITIRSSRPALASEVLVALHNGVDNYLRRRTLDRSTQYIAYINKMLGTVTVGEYRLALIETASEQEKLRMAASLDLPFVAEPFGAPVISPKPVSPNMPVLWFIGIVFGASLGAAYTRLKTSWLYRAFRRS